MRKLLPFVLLIATAAAAQTRTRATVPPHQDMVSNNMVSGIVTSVSGPIIQLANGLVSIDTTGAKIADVDSVAAITPGSLVVAILKPGDVAPNAPLPAAFVGVTHLAAVSFVGPVTAVDLPNSTITLLGRTIRVTPQTAISTMFPTFKAPVLGDIVPGMVAQVDANASGNALVASAIRVMSLNMMPMPTVVHGTAKSIANDSWVVTANGKDVTVKIGANTKIVGDPKVGDTVDIVVDSNGVALLIIKSLAGQFHMTGYVSSIGPEFWSISIGPPGSMAPVTKVIISATTLIVGNPKVGDRVEVVGDATPGGVVASSITKLP